MINEFSEKFESARGKEWFKGNVNEMIKEIQLLINDYDKIKEIENKNEYSSQFCDKKFKTEIILLTHQKIAKYCLKKQGIKNESYKCPHCYKNLSTNERLNTHLNICELKDSKNLKEREKLKEKLKEKDQEIEKYKIESLLKDKMIEELRILLQKAYNAMSDISKLQTTINTNDNRR